MSSALHPFRFFLLLALGIAAFVGAVSPAFTQQVGGSSGLPLPRFVTIRNAPVNVRVGPGTQYDIAFTFVRPGVPVEIVQEFDTWRRIRDVEGDEGWVHTNLVVGDRTAIISPWSADGPIALRTEAAAEAPVRAWLSSNMLVSVRSCDGRFCEVGLTYSGPDGRNANYRGFVGQETLWGVYEGEIWD